MNKVCLIGRISNDLELKTTSTGKSNCEFDLAVKRAFDKNSSDFLRCVVWNQAAENLVKYKAKGDLIAVEGSVQADKYRSNDEKNHKKYYIIVGNIEYLGPTKEKTEPDEYDFGEDLPF